MLGIICSTSLLVVTLLLVPMLHCWMTSLEHLNLLSNHVCILVRVNFIFENLLSTTASDIGANTNNFNKQQILGKAEDTMLSSKVSLMDDGSSFLFLIFSNTVSSDLIYFFALVLLAFTRLNCAMIFLFSISSSTILLSFDEAT